MRRFLLSFIFFFISFFLLSQTSWAGLPQFADLAEKSGQAVVNISTVKLVERPDIRQFFRGFPERRHPFEDFFDQFERFFGEPERGPQEQRSLGSGFIISQDGYIVTNNHVIAGADQIKVTFQIEGSDRNFDAQVIGSDPETDLALLKIETDIDLPVLKFGDSEKLRVGEWVVAIGNPFGLSHTVTAGIISAKGRIIGAGPYDNFIQTDASINPGNSGGPLLNLKGEVIGINTAIVAAGQGIGFAIPSTMAQDIIQQLQTDQKVSRGWLGVTIQNLDENTARALGLDEAKGALVAGVTQGDPAEQAGIQAGDVILAINDLPVENSTDLTRRIGGIAPGSETRITIWRDGETVSLSVTLGERDTQRLAGTQRVEPEETRETELGLSIRPPSPEEASALGLDSPRGLLVSQVESGSKAHRADIVSGDLILQANGRQVNSVQEFNRILNEDARPKNVLMLLINRQGQNLFRTIPLDN
ncbi:DegQ family serine endoprotease [Desulfonatronovibrio hydrogenovorans]|uniref:DegQ family serine endoprotease n=1 Tax=Desulfonatronovibrio hydrogenovorans TaxID=53245 RepID=UPI00048C7E51|nr:DegQ family serine endoprotease [Desulfonatronovibrio hydrogenovorans]